MFGVILPEVVDAVIPVVSGEDVNLVREGPRNGSQRVGLRDICHGRYPQIWWHPAGFRKKIMWVWSNNQREIMIFLQANSKIPGGSRKHGA
jgi:hypothetical protein